jgi:hypothetical protein
MKDDVDSAGQSHGPGRLFTLTRRGILVLRSVDIPRFRPRLFQRFYSNAQMRTCADKKTAYWRSTGSCRRQAAPPSESSQADSRCTSPPLLLRRSAVPHPITVAIDTHPFSVTVSIHSDRVLYYYSISRWHPCFACSVQRACSAARARPTHCGSHLTATPQVPRALHTPTAFPSTLFLSHPDYCSLRE